MNKTMKNDIVTQQVRAFMKLMFHDVREIRAILPRELNRRMFVLRFIMLAVAAFETLTIYAIAFFSASIGAPEAVRNSFFFRHIFKALPALSLWCEDNRKFLFFMAVLTTLFIIVKNMMTAFSNWRTAVFSEDVSRGIGTEIMQRFLYSPYRWHLSSNSTATFQAMSYRASVASLVTSLLNMQSYVVTTLFLFLGLMYVAPLLTLFVYIVMGGVGLITYKLIRKSADRAGTELSAAMSRENSAVMSALRGIREVLIYRQQPVFLKSVADAARDGTRHRAYLTIVNSVPSWTLEASGFFIISLAILMLIQLQNASMAQITTIVILLMLNAWRVLPSINRVVNLMILIRGLKPAALPCLEMLKSLRANVMEIPPPPDPNFVFTHEIRLNNVYFSYPGAGVDSLSNISLAIPKGGLIGFIGPSGGGKSTISAIISGLMEPTSGIMFVDGRQLSPAERAAYSMRVGYVPQSPYLMAGTVAENVAFSEWGKPYNETRVLDACRRAAADFITPERGGILMHLGENGVGLSGGQAQRVTIARALYSNPDILIFDEATSSLDQANEKVIQETIISLRKSITCIIIAHRLTTIEACDYIYWLDKGKIFAEGNPREILPRYNDYMKSLQQV